MEDREDMIFDGERRRREDEDAPWDVPDGRRVYESTLLPSHLPALGGRRSDQNFRLCASLVFMADVCLPRPAQEATRCGGAVGAAPTRSNTPAVETG